MPVRVARFLPLLLLVASAAGGCSTFRPPGIELVDATVTAVTDEAMEVGIGLVVSNPNDETIRLLQFDYDVTVDGARVFTGRRAAQVALNIGADRRIMIPAVVRFDLAGWTDGPPSRFRMGVAGTLLYVTPGELAEILLDTGLRRPRAGFRFDVEVDGERPGDSNPGP